jgi:hypothetical protein
MKKIINNSSSQMSSIMQTETSSMINEERSQNNNNSFLQTKAGRYAGVVGSCAGAAAVGLTRAGPVGRVAGFLVGSQVGSQPTQAAVSSNEDAALDDLILEQLDRGTTPNNEEIRRQMNEEETRRQP